MRAPQYFSQTNSRRVRFFFLSRQRGKNLADFSFFFVLPKGTKGTESVFKIFSFFFLCLAKERRFLVLYKTVPFPAALVLIVPNTWQPRPPTHTRLQTQKKQIRGAQYVCIATCTYTDTHTDTQTHRNTHTHTHRHTHTHACMHA